MAAQSMGTMNRPAEVFLQGLQCIEDAICIGRINTSLVLNMLRLNFTFDILAVNFIGFQIYHLFYVVVLQTVSDCKQIVEMLVNSVSHCA